MGLADRRHEHLIVRAEVMKPPGPDDCKDIEQWMTQLILDIDMQILRDPSALYWPGEGNRGMTCDGLLTTSNTCLHTWDEVFPAMMEFDLYTCSCLPVETVIKAFDRFEPVKIEYKLYDRATGLVLIRESHPVIAESKPEQKCSFCWKPRAAVEAMVACWQEQFICNECVDICSNVLRQHGVRADVTRTR